MILFRAPLSTTKKQTIINDGGNCDLNNVTGRPELRSQEKHLSIEYVILTGTSKFGFEN